MDDLYRVGERVAQENAGFPGAGFPGGGLPPGFPGGGLPPGFPGGGEGQSLEELLGGGADIEEYLQSYEQMLQDGTMPQQGPQLNQVDAEGGITVRPDAGFVVKTRDIQSGMKVFLNIVSNEHVEKPHMKSLAELEGEEGCRVPLSIGTPVEDFDKKQEPCVTYDLVANPDVVKECKELPQFRDSLVQLCFAAIAQKYKVELDMKYKLPKMIYKGNTIQLQRLRVKKDSQIEEVAGERVAGDESTQEGAASGPKRPDFVVYYANSEVMEKGEPLLDGFAQEWGAAPEEIADADCMTYLSGWDLPIYRVNAFQEKIRGTMKNRQDREKAEAEAVAEDQVEPGVKETRQMLRGRTCVVQVKMPDLDRQTPALKQFNIEVSDECLRLTFPQLPRVAKQSDYLTLTVWWPRNSFHSIEATAAWNAKADVLTVTLPTETPESASSFDQELLDVMF